jgi:hypothetical protein
MRPPRALSGGPSAIQLVEESVHLLRRTPAVVLAIYYAGTAPFALALVFSAQRPRGFGRRMSWLRGRPSA